MYMSVGAVATEERTVDVMGNEGPLAQQAGQPD